MTTKVKPAKRKRDQNTPNGNVISLKLEPERFGVEVVQPITWHDQQFRTQDKVFFQKSRRISEDPDSIVGPMKKMSLSKVSEVRSGFRDDEDFSISAIPIAGDESPFGPLLDPNFTNESIFDL